MMKYFRGERGLAMLEAVLATAVVGILISIALPKLSLALDVSYADYEIRCLHSMFHYAKSANRLSNYNSFGFNKMPVDVAELIFLTDAPGGATFYVRSNKNKNNLKDRHVLKRNFRLNLNSINFQTQFNVDGDLSPAASGSITLKNDNVSRKLTVTHYGRARIER